MHRNKYNRCKSCSQGRMHETWAIFFALVRNRKSEGKQSIYLKVLKKPFMEDFETSTVSDDFRYFFQRYFDKLCLAGSMPVISVCRWYIPAINGSRLLEICGPRRKMDLDSTVGQVAVRCRANHRLPLYLWA